MANPRQKSWIIDLVAVQIQHRQNGTVPDGIEKLIDVPTSGQWTGFSFAITDMTNEINPADLNVPVSV